MLKNVWQFEDLHKQDETPAYIHRIRKAEVKHVNAISETLIITNNAQDNIDVFGADTPQVLRTLNIQGRQMNCSAVTADKLFVGCRDRRIFIYKKLSLELLKTLEMPESVHCMSPINGFSQVVVGMTDGHIVILSADEEGSPGFPGVQVKYESHFKEIGGIWSICGVNNDSELALGCFTGVHIVTIGVTALTRTSEQYMKDKNVWNVSEYDTNKIVCT